MRKFTLQLLSVLLILCQPLAMAGPLTTPYFTKVNDKTGLVGVGAFHKISVADLNGDGYPDLLMHKATQETSPDDSKVVNHQYLYLNVPGDDPNDPYSRKFVDYTASSGIRTKRSGALDGRHSSFSVFADVDNDGDLDMFSGVFSYDIPNYTDRGDRNDLFLNDGAGRFVLAGNSTFHIENLGLYDGLMNTAAATFLDYDLDGNIDMFLGNWLCCNFSPGTDVDVRDQLYRGNGNGAFTNVTATTGISTGKKIPSFAVTAADWNNDGYMDLFESDYCRNEWPDSSIHWKNNGNGTFSQVQAITNYGQYIGNKHGSDEKGDLRRASCSFGSMPRDFDNDGDIDFLELIVHGSETAVHSAILKNDQQGSFSWNFDEIARPDDPEPRHYRDHYGSWFDIDNDGLTDFVLSKCCLGGDKGNRISIFRQSENHTFSNETLEAGFGGMNADGSLRFHYVIPLDYDLDGDEDLLIGFANENEIQLWRNDVGTQNNWLTLTLKGSGKPGLSNSSAIGAWVEVTADSVTYTREIYAGNGQFGPQVPLSLTFGLNQSEKMDSIKVRWPNKAHTLMEFKDVSANQFITIGEYTATDLVGDKGNIRPDDPDDAPPRSERVVNLLDAIATDPGQGSGVDLDVGEVGGERFTAFDRPVGFTHNFMLPSDALITAATIKTRVRGNTSLVSNDVLIYDESDLDNGFLPFIALIDLNKGVKPAAGDILEFEINLAKIPVRIACPECAPGEELDPIDLVGGDRNGEYRNLLSQLSDGQFDILYSDDLTVDFSKLRITYVLPSAPAGDLTGDNTVDRDDLDIIIAALNTDAYGSDDPRDLDSDGRITILDARKEVVLCWQNGRPRCAK